MPSARMNAKALLIGGILFGILVASFTAGYRITVNELHSHFDYNRWVSEPG